MPRFNTRAQGSPRRREPEILPHDEQLKALSKECKEKARALGHDPLVWRMDDNWGEVKCDVCGLVAGLALHPPLNGQKVAGPMLNKGCGK